MTRLLSTALAAASMLAGTAAHAAFDVSTRDFLVPSVGVGSGVTSPSGTLYAGDNRFSSSAGLNHNGVARLNVDNGSATPVCTGSLLTTGRHILTAAHCVTNSSGERNVSSVMVTWQLPDGDIQLTSTSIDIHPDWNGSSANGHDVAIITLPEIAPFDVPRYDIYRGSIDGLFGQPGIKVGYGRTGLGSSGDVIAEGTKRAGLNAWESTGLGLLGVSGVTNNDTQLTFDFDAPSTELDRTDIDAFGFFFDFPEDLGFDADEVGTAPGDSGGPTFLELNGDFLIAGTVSYGLRLSSSGSTSDVDPLLNSSWGEFGVDANISALAPYIDSITGVPEPRLAGLALGTIAMGIIATRQRRRLRPALV